MNLRLVNPTYLHLRVLKLLSITVNIKITYYVRRYTGAIYIYIYTIFTYNTLHTLQLLIRYK